MPNIKHRASLFSYSYLVQVNRALRLRRVPRRNQEPLCIRQPRHIHASLRALEMPAKQHLLNGYVRMLNGSEITVTSIVAQVKRERNVV